MPVYSSGSTYDTCSNPVSTEARTLLSVESPDADSYKRRETRLAEICMRHGVLIAPGHVYAPEEYGWFRLTFTVGEESLKEGLNRVKRADLSNWEL
jgi:DNA-binding transcriptional MocR family regulator